MEDDKLDETIEELKAALAELESEDGLERFVGGHGLQSRFFAFEWRGERLEIDFDLPYARVLSGEGVQTEDDANIGAAIRLAILLLVADREGRLLSDGEATLSVFADDQGMGYVISDSEGEILDSGDDWEPLVARLGATVADDDGGGLQIIWP